MLYYLTGEIQVGKTRYLQEQIRLLNELRIPTYGVIAPGDWRDHGPKSKYRYEKLGIYNQLLPNGDKFTFAKRPDLVKDSEDFPGINNKSVRGWVFSSRAVQRVNDHFDNLIHIAKCDDHSTVKSQQLGNTAKPGFLVVDELGRMELLQNKGVQSAMTLLKMGPTPLAQDAIVVVRKSLLPNAQAHISPYWPEHMVIEAGFPLPQLHPETALVHCPSA